MSGYLETLIATSALVGICSYISYGDKYDKTLKFAASAVLLCTVIAPFLSFVKDVDLLVPDTENSEEITFGESELSDDIEQAFCIGIEKYVCEEFSLSDDEVTVIVFGFSPLTMKAEKIKVILYGSAVFADNRAIAARIESADLGECEVEIGVK